MFKKTNPYFLIFVGILYATAVPVYHNYDITQHEQHGGFFLWWTIRWIYYLGGREAVLISDVLVGAIFVYFGIKKLKDKKIKAPDKSGSYVLNKRTEK